MRPDQVYVVDDDPSVLGALTRLLRSQGFQATGFRSAEGLFAASLSDADPSCLVVDLRLPGLSGLDLQGLLAQFGLEMAVVFISGGPSFASGVRAMRNGAVDFLEKPISPDRLLAAVRRGLDQDRARKAIQADRATLNARYDTLTRREREVFSLIVAGRLNKQVGSELGAALKTVKIHRARVMKKDAGGVVRRASANGPKARWCRASLSGPHSRSTPQAYPSALSQESKKSFQRCAPTSGCSPSTRGSRLRTPTSGQRTRYDPGP